MEFLRPFFGIPSNTFFTHFCFVCFFLLWPLLVVAERHQEPECGGDINLNRTTFSLSSPEYPGSLPRHFECLWRVRNPRGLAVVVQAINLDFGSEIKDDCKNGVLEIFNGCGSERFLVEKICQRHKTSQDGLLWVSSGSCVTIKFSSGKHKDNKFLLSVAESAASCGDILKNNDNNNQTFEGRLPAHPGGSNKCVWIIVVQTGIIELAFKDRFQVTSLSQDCKENYVQVQDGRYSASPVLGRFCGTSRPYPVYSSGKYLRVTLHRSRTGITSKHSFKAQYTVVDSTPASKSSYCGHDVILGPGDGRFSTPRYPEQYLPDLTCIWKIEVDSKNKIILRFQEFDVEGDSQVCPDDSDHAKVFNGLASWSPVIGRYCGRVIPSTIKSKTNKLRIEFRSNRQYAGRGFEAVFSVQSEKPDGETRNHFTGIMIGATCGVVFIVLSILAVFHTRKLRRQRAQSRISEVASTASFDVHHVNAPPSYDLVMASPDLFPSKERQQSRGYSGVPHLHREISHLLGDPESDDEDLPPYPGLPGRDGVVEFCFGQPSDERRRSHSKERHVSESEQPSCQISAVWYRRWPTDASTSPNVRNLESASENEVTTLERQDSKETVQPVFHRMDTTSSFVTDV
ncbi:tolloid-like protein 1 isoform X1 [Stylophora pistillata]|uniref:Cubilin n=1 Tax=Stylophora pistillata TaxID=50429 RepID=A0A2B4RH98_STYPI|nr:tolloid-like protein 1 isoform X1 [Stylophora pistillata]PFX16991.1 Cubilin [Stylophora pistillata]